MKNGNKVETVKSVELFKGFSIGERFTQALHVKNVKKEATAVLHEKGKHKGEPVLKKNGEAKMTAPVDYTTIQFLNLEAPKDKPSIKATTGLTGQDLFDFEATAQRESNIAYLAFVAEMLNSGAYDFRRARVNNRNGVFSSTLRPSKERVVQVVTKEQALKVLGITSEQYEEIAAKMAKQVR